MELMLEDKIQDGLKAAEAVKSQVQILAGDLQARFQSMGDNFWKRKNYEVTTLCRAESLKL